MAGGINGLAGSLPLAARFSAASDLDGNGVAVRPVVSIVGTTAPGALVTIDQGADGSIDRAGPANRAGRFVFAMRLDQGENDFRIVARDRSGNTAATELSILRGDVVLNWNATLLNLIREGRLNPLVATRDLAMLHTAIYDSVNAIDRRFESYAVDVTARRGASAAAAAATAGYQVMASLFPNATDRLDASLEEGLSGVARGRRRREGVRIGELVGNSIIALRANDGSSATVTYTPTNTPGRWRPIPTVPGGPSPAALGPQWVNVKPWAMTSGSQFRNPPPPALDSVAYAEAVNQVKAIGAADSTVRTQDQSNIALFWNDQPGSITPPGHWNQIAANLATQRRNTLSDNARLFALLNITTADSAIACWDTKFAYDLWRPYSAIRLADQDGNPQTEPDPNWQAFIFIPPFPTYTSGHSTFSGGASRILAQFFGGDSIAFTASADVGVNVPERSFSSFSAAAREAADSRLFGGIHFSFDNQSGLDTGIALGNYVYANFLRPRR